MNKKVKIRDDRNKLISEPTLVDATTALGSVWLHDPKFVHLFAWMDPSCTAHIARLKWFNCGRSQDDIINFSGSPIVFPKGFVPEHLLCAMTWYDQGWGNRKGTVLLGTNPLSDKPAHHKKSTMSCAVTLFRNEDGGQRVYPNGVVRTDVTPFLHYRSGTWCLTVAFRVGGGGGHELHIEEMDIIALPRISFWERVHALCKVRKQIIQMSNTSELSSLRRDPDRGLIASLCAVFPVELLVTVCLFIEPVRFAQWALMARDESEPYVTRSECGYYPHIGSPLHLQPPAKQIIDRLRLCRAAPDGATERDIIFDCARPQSASKFVVCRHDGVILDRPSGSIHYQLANPNSGYFDIFACYCSGCHFELLSGSSRVHLGVRPPNYRFPHREWVRQGAQIWLPANAPLTLKTIHRFPGGLCSILLRPVTESECVVLKMRGASPADNVALVDGDVFLDCFRPDAVEGKISKSDLCFSQDSSGALSFNLPTSSSSEQRFAVFCLLTSMELRPAQLYIEVGTHREVLCDSALGFVTGSWNSDDLQWFNEDFFVTVPAATEVRLGLIAGKGGFPGLRALLLRPTNAQDFPPGGPPQSPSTGTDDYEYVEETTWTTDSTDEDEDTTDSTAS